MKKICSILIVLLLCIAFTGCSKAGNIAIPGSSNEDHIQENYEIFDFELSEEEMQRMSDLDRNERFVGY